jgi:AcrR family transcriptional regulator
MMARTVNPAQHRAKRQQIMYAAAGLFATQGYQATTVAQICDAAGISAGSLFHYFSSKRELFAAIITDDGDDTTARQLNAAQRADDPLAGVLDFVDHLAAAAAEPAVPGLVLEAMLQAHRDAELAELMGDGSDAEQAGVAALLTRAAEAGAIDPAIDIEQTAAWIMAMVGALYLHGATDEQFDAAHQRPLLRRTVQRLLSPEG